ncbi:MAG: DUF4422 domain-containing protein [Kiritimatiellae bacterium]|nr:DUF4422 domain-containing protein [Kiritimatiellia bacterium]
MGLSTFDAFKHLNAGDAVPLEGERLASLQRCLTSILDDILAVARDTGTRLILGGGTALGAARHRGFIPWDDDLDVNMPRADWPRFRDAFMARFGEKYAIFEPGAPKSYGLCFPRIRLRGTSFVTREDLVNPPACPGVFVDVFLSDGVPDNSVLRRAHGLGSLALGFLYSCRKAFAESRWHRRWGLSGGVFVFKRGIGFMLAFMSLGRWTRLWNRWNGLCRGKSSRFVTYPVGRRHYFGELAPRAELTPGAPLEFEGRSCPCASGIAAYMTRLYGPDYMTPPPESDRERHVVFRPFFLNREDSELEMVVATHKQYVMPQDAVYLPVFVGAALSGDAAVPPGFARDDEGENISAKNRGWCELTALYWAWKNTKADAVGLVHYRRHFRGRGGIASGAEICDALSRADAVLPKKRNYFIESTYSQYIHAHHAEDLDGTRRILEERHPDCVAAFDAVMKSTSGHRFNMMVMKRPLFDDYCAWLFDVLFELERRLDISSYSDYDRRVFGFVAERLLDVYVLARKVSFVEMPVMHLESQHWPRKIAAFLRRKLSSGTRK